MSRYFAWASAALLFVFAACKDQAPPPPPTVNGFWTGTSGSMTLSLTLAQNSAAVTGSGQVSVPGEAIALTVQSGTFVHPTLSATLAATGYEPMNYTGTMSQSNANQIVGRLNGSGFQNESVVLTRAP